MDGASGEILRRTKGINLHPILSDAPLIYDETGRKELTEINNRYINIAKSAQIPFFISTPTWKANYERVYESGINKEINVDSVNFI